MKIELPIKDTSTHDMFVDLGYFITQYVGLIAVLYTIAWLIGFTPGTKLGAITLIGMFVYKSYIKPMWMPKS